jgi:hypothetical protein
MLSKSFHLRKAFGASFTKNLLAVTSSRNFGSGVKYEKFDYTDPFNMADLLTEEEKMI